MDRVKINVSNFENPRFDNENFSFTDKEKKALSNELNKIEALIPEVSKLIFSISKYENLFKGSLKIDSHDIFTYDKNSSAIDLFNILRMRIEKRILKENQKCIEEKNHLLRCSAPENTITELFPIKFNLKPRIT